MELDSSLASTTKTMVQPTTTTGRPLNDGESFSTESFDIYHQQRCLARSRCLRISVSCLLVIVLVGLGVAVIVYGVKLNGRIEALESRVESLEAEHNRTTFKSSTEVANAESSALQAGWIQEFHDHIAELRNSLTTTREMVSDMASFTNQSIAEMKENVHEMNESLATHTNASTRERFAGCYDQQHTCTIGVGTPLNNNTYYKGCRTDLVPRHIPVSQCTLIHSAILSGFLY